MIHTWDNLEYSELLSDKLYHLLKKPVINYYKILQKPLTPIITLLEKVDSTLVNEVKVLRIFLPHNYWFYLIPTKIEFGITLGRLPQDIVKTYLERDFSEDSTVILALTKEDYKNLETYKIISNNILTTLHYFTFIANRYCTDESMLPYPKDIIEHMLALSPQKKVSNLHPWAIPTLRDSVAKKDVNPTIENLKYTNPEKINKMTDLLLLLRMLA